MNTHDPAWDALRAEAKRMDIVEIARKLGARLKPSTNRYLVGPCPRGCASTDGFVISPKKQLFLCRPTGGKEGSGDAIAMVMHAQGCGYREALAFIVGRPGATIATPSPATRPARRPTEEDEEEPERERVARPTTTAQAMALWNAGRDPRDTPGQSYLNRDRKLDLDPELCGEVLRWHTGINALLALFRNIETGEPQAVTRILLDRDAHKTARMFTGPVGGAAIMLDAFENVLDGLHIGEGVETGMAARHSILGPRGRSARRPSRNSRFSPASAL